MALAIASDHAGRLLKDTLLEHLKSQGADIVDLGVHTGDSVDYPSYAKPLAEAVAAKKFDLGILVCGTGTGMAIAANKVHGVRAANCTNELLAQMARAHNDANILCLGERIVGPGLAVAIVDTFIATRFAGGRHQRRVDLIASMDEER